LLCKVAIDKKSKHKANGWIKDIKHTCQ